MAQYYEVLSQGDKTSEQFFNTVEDPTVQYVISPDKTQVQYPTQQIVVTSGDQLMVVDGQQQIVLDQTSAIAYQGQQIQVQVQQQPIQLQQQIQQTQVQVQQQQYAVIQDGLTNGTQQIFYMESNSNDHIAMDQSAQQNETTQQPIVLNHQISQGNSIVTNKVVNPAQMQRQIRGAIRQPLLQQQPRAQNRQLQRPPLANQIRQQNANQQTVNQALIRMPANSQVRQQNTASAVRPPMAGQITRPVTPNQQQFRPQNPSPVQIRPQTPNQQMKLVNPNQQQQVRQLNQSRASTQQMQKTISARFQGPSQILQKVNTQPQIDINDTEIKSSDEQDAISLPDGSVVSVAVYKKMLADQKRVSLLQQRNNASQVNCSPNQSSLPNTPPNAGPKKRNSNPRGTPRQTTGRATPARAPARPRNAVNQFPPGQQAAKAQQANDPARYAMMNQAQSQQQVGKQQFQNVLPNQMLQQQQRNQQMRQSQANYVIQPPKPNQKPQQQRPLPSYIPSTQIQKIIESTPVGEEFSDSIRMLVLLENGEQRLITFTLPKEACTIQEILEQVNVPFRNDTNIQVTEANTNGINYIVTVGNVPCFGYEDEDVPMQEESSQSSQPSQPSLAPLTPQPSQESQQASPCAPVNSQLPAEAPRPPSPEPPKEPPPKYVPGMLALCAGCGYLSEDFAKCIRCNRKLPDNVKAIPATIRSNNAQKKELQGGQVQQQSKTIPINLKPQTLAKKKLVKNTKIVEHESVVISSDDEEEEKPSKAQNENILQKLGASITISPVTKEPSTNDIQKHSIIQPKVSVDPTEEGEDDSKFVSMTVHCRTIRIGSYRFIPPEKVVIDSKQVVMKVPHPYKENEIITITINIAEIVKVLVSFNKSLPVYFYYLNPALAKIIREELDMTPEGDYYYDPLSSKDESYRRVTLLPEEVADDDKMNFLSIYRSLPGVLDELNAKEANDILIKTCPKELNKTALTMGTFTEIKQLITYPREGRGRISINTEDYVCLAQDQFLNDVIIDFYLKYLLENLPPEQKEKVHVFSTFFYKRLTTKPTKASRKCQPAELDPTLSPAQKRHARVKTWTKNINLFEKDFVVVPINENAHWFLAIICFPGMNGCQTWDGKPYKLEVRSRKKKKPVTVSVGSVSITPVKPEPVEKPIVCEDPELSDKDEAEGDDSELDSDDSEELPLSQSLVSSTTVPSPPVAPPLATSTPPRQPKEPRPPIKQPCILIFDSLAGASRSRVVATLRDYLTCEYKVKLGKEKIYNKDVIKGASPKVPQQNNFTDCGLYLLQYVEQFFKDPIKDYHIPISQIKNWFEEIVVTKKREDIANLIKELMKENDKDVRLLPDICFPTLNGKLVERDPEEEEEEEDETMEDEEFPSDEQGVKDNASTVAEPPSNESILESSVEESKEEEEASMSPLKPSNEGVSSDFVTQTVLNPKPDISEFPRQTNRDTLSYLKAKRIIRHKNTEGPDVKKVKSDNVQ